MNLEGVSADARAEDDRIALDLVRRIAAGDADAETALVERHGRGLRYLLLRLSGDPSRADDLFQDTFRVVLEKLRGGELREPEKLAGFIRGVARNLWFGETRKRRRRGEPADLEAVPEPVDPRPGTLGRVIREEDRLRVRQLLAELPSSRDREVLFRFYIAEEPRALISRELGVGERQLNVVLFRARRRFRQLLEAAGEIGSALVTPSGGDPARSVAGRRDEDG